MYRGRIVELIALAVAALAACAAPSGQGVGSQKTLTANEVARATQHLQVQQPKTELTALKEVLLLFASVDGERWDRYGAIASVAWLDAAPVEYADGKYARNGQLLLNGFDSARLPNGKTGAEYQLVDGNEGQSGITLDGDIGQVKMVSVSKYYFSEDYSDVLKRQLGSNGDVTLMADRCTPEDEAENPGGSSFFRIGLPDGETIYVEAFLEAATKYSPGATVFDFQRKAPVDRIVNLHCQKA